MTSRTRTAPLISFFSLLLVCTALQALPAAHSARLTYRWDYHDNIEIATPVDTEHTSAGDTLRLPANLFVPQSTSGGQRFPAVIMIPGWAGDEHQRTAAARFMADAGYIVMRYTPRGFHSADGMIDTGGPNDIMDARQAISTLIENTPVDPDKIALAGHSYGAGIAITTAFEDQRVAAVVASNACGNLQEALRPSGTPKEFWIHRLIMSSNPPQGNRSPEFLTMMNNLYRAQNTNALEAWLAERSPDQHLPLSTPERRLPALYVVNNLQDYLCTPNTIIPLLKRYPGPWHIDFISGGHGQSDIDPQEPLENLAAGNAMAWLNHFLRDEQNYINVVDKISTRVKSSPLAPIDTFARFPVQDRIVTYFGEPETGAQGGALMLTPTQQADTPEIDATFDRVWTGGNRGAAMMSSRYYRPLDIDRRGALVFTSSPLPDSLMLRGSAVVNFWAHVEPGQRYFGYLLDYDPETGWAAWVGHGPFTWWPESDPHLPPGAARPIRLEMYWTAHDIAAGHQLILVVDGADREYEYYNEVPPLRHFVIDSEHPLFLEVPIIDRREIADTIARPQALADAEEEAEQDANDRGLDGQGVAYGPGSGSISSEWILLLVLWLGLRARRLACQSHAAR